MKFQVNISKDDREKSRKRNLAMGNTSSKSGSNATKVELDLYYVMTNLHTKFQVNTVKLAYNEFPGTPVKTSL